MKHAKIVNGVVDVISLTNPTGGGWVGVPDSVYAGFTYNGDGTFTAPAPPPATTDDVDGEKNSRINSGFTFAGKLFQSRPDDRENIQGAYSAAFSAIVLMGAQPGDLRWSNPDEDFVWIAEDNTTMAMDAPTVLAFGNEAKAHKQGLIFAARDIKADVEAGTITTKEEVENDPRWP